LSTIHLEDLYFLSPINTAVNSFRNKVKKLGNSLVEGLLFRLFFYTSTSIYTIPAKSFRALTNKYFMAIFREAGARAD
jgi:hypothetical protein